MLRRGIASSPCTIESTHPSQPRANSSETQDGVANEYTVGPPRDPTLSAGVPLAASWPRCVDPPHWRSLRSSLLRPVLPVSASGFDGGGVVVVVAALAESGGSDAVGSGQRFCRFCCCCCSCWRRAALSRRSMDAIAAIPPPILCPVKQTLNGQRGGEGDCLSAPNLLVLYQVRRACIS